VSVDTNVKGKNLSPYRKVRVEGYQILLAPPLVGMVDSIRVVTRGRWRRSLAVELRGAAGPGAGKDVCCPT
jgi:hypothetical protein